MKAIKNTLQTSLLLGLFMTFFACEQFESESIEVVGKFDKTGSNEKESFPDTNDIISFFDLDHYPLNSGTVQLSVLGDVSLETISQVSLDPVAVTEYQPFVREAEIKDFKTEVDSILTEIKHRPLGRPLSSLFIPIRDEIKRLSQSKAQKKYLLLYSDLFENSATFSVYRASKSSQKFTQEFEEFLDNYIQLPTNLEGLTVFIIHKPDRFADGRFQIISGAFKERLQSKGAQVHIQANLLKR